MVGIDADGYGHSLARTHIHNSHTTQTLTVCCTLVGSEMAPPKNREFTTHSTHSQLTLTPPWCLQPSTYKTKLSSHLCLKSEMFFGDLIRLFVIVTVHRLILQTVTMTTLTRQGGCSEMECGHRRGGVKLILNRLDAFVAIIIKELIWLSWC